MEKKLNIVQGTNDKPAASKSLVQFFMETPGYAGELFIGYPLISTADGGHAIDAILVSPDKGVVVFDLIEGNKLGDFAERQDDSHNKLVAKLQNHRELMLRRNLLVDVHTLSFAPAIQHPDVESPVGITVTNPQTLKAALDSLDWPNHSDIVYRSALSVLQSISSIRKSRSKRIVKNDRSRAGKLKRLEDSIATLDPQQNKAVIETVNGVQRIRGLAGSGKTIVLALKAAYLHRQHPEWRIAVTFNTRSLKGQFKKHIYNFCVDGGDEPNWNMLRILNAWGAPGGGEREGMYYEFCRAHGVEYLDFRAAKDRFGGESEFDGACTKALNQAKEAKPIYDAILVDEAQDFPPSFLRLCYELLDDHKRLVYAYDELQNLSGGSLPSPELMFGNKLDGTPKVKFEPDVPGVPRQDIILDTCYRNSRPVLVAAHALGFGIYRTPPAGRNTGLVQMFDHPTLWEEIGYEIKGGVLEDNHEVTLRRTQRTSPPFLEEHSLIEDLVFFKKFDTEEEQSRWLSKAIKANIEQDELRHDDIVVINPDPITTRASSGPIRKQLMELGIHSHIAGVDTNPDVFFNTETDSVTFTGIFRAKGNEAGMVYIINAHDCESAQWNLSTIRNRLFTAITRSKAWVRVLGIGEPMDRLMDEFDRLKKKDFELSFRYPTKQERRKLKMVHRDMTEADKKKEVTKQELLFEIEADLEKGMFDLDDLPPSLLSKLEEKWRKRTHE